MVVVVWFVYKSRVTWLELKDFMRIAQAKNLKNLHFLSSGEGLGLTSTGNFPTSVRAAVHHPERFSLRDHPQNF
jgi:hypothetical protein